MEKYVNLFFDIAYVLNGKKCLLCMGKTYNKICKDCIVKIQRIMCKDDILIKHKIYSKKDYKEWSKRNHPDKGGDTRIFTEVTNLVRDRFK